ncbi:electron transfer flavoprotein subunit alpha/FixB family protein [Mariniplasma anaerobium]|uniref:Electron transfer flavoprotein subunit alpha n=1 Tax=Mariniplasma anaerobium TaxID=2735436 RepID=A0A7U9TII6_9MOLU|nr:electron transfer flavoprotein subunit alpha/FixB family protein [Mariniplasma anaerobium]BCR36020.1 electron transfer flavoprotein subunit alpha [Mariniplasma anaerobium]
MKSIAIFIERRNQKICSVGLELLSETKRLLKDSDNQIVALYLTDKKTDEDINRLETCGADKIITYVDPQFQTYDTLIYTKGLENIIKTNDFDVLLLGSTLIGRDLGPRLSARVHTGLTADATLLEFEQTEERLNLLATRPALGGNLFATIICPDHKPQMATIRPGVFSIEVFDNHKAEKVIFEEKILIKSKVEILSKKVNETAYVDLTKAKLIIAGGRGVATMFPTLKEIALLTGGEVAASRAVVDQNIEPKDRQVGQTGVTVRPSVYVASGISGAIQHMSGMDKSEMIIAINTDPNALIFNVADISIIADANKVLPLLKEEIQLIKHQL